MGVSTSYLTPPPADGGITDGIGDGITDGTTNDTTNSATSGTRNSAAPSGTTNGSASGTPGPIALITVDFPPVNALPVQGWYDLAAAVRAAGRDTGVRCVVLAAAGRGFNAGVDIKEMQRTAGHAALIGANHGCYEAFAAVYECEVPVVAAVQGHCLGGGIGLVGNADAIVASDDATFGLPELDRGALGAATHLARLVPPHLVRTLYYTSRTITARELHQHGSVWEVVPREKLLDAALSLAGEIAAKDGYLIRLAKAAINGIDPVDVRRSYRFEQGFTFEANLSGIADRHRDAFVSPPVVHPPAVPPPVVPPPEEDES